MPMNWRQRIGRFIAGDGTPNRRALTTANVLTPFEVAGGRTMPNQPVWTEMTAAKATREGYKLSVYVYRAVRMIAQNASIVPWRVYRATYKDGQVPDLTPLPNHPLQKVLDKPNKAFSGQKLREFMFAHRKLVGNALWYPIVVRGEIKELWPVMPDKVQPIPSSNPGEWLAGWRVETGPSQYKTQPADAFIHFMEIDPGNPYWGIGPLLAAARTVDTDNDMQAWNKVSAQRRAIPDGVFSHSEVMDDEEWKVATQRVKERYQTGGREPWVLGAGAKWQQMSLSPVEMDYIESRLKNMRDVATAFGLWSILLNDMSEASYNNAKEARRAMYEDVIIPDLDDIRDTLNAVIQPLYGEDIYVSYDISNVPALRTDFGEKVDQAHKIFDMGVPFNAINERIELGFDPIEGGDEGYLPAHMVPIGGSAKQPSEGKSSGDGTKLSAEPGEFRSFNLTTDTQRLAYWKSFNAYRDAWILAYYKQVSRLFSAESALVQDAIAKSDSGVVAHNAIEAVDHHRSEWASLMASVFLSAVDDFGTRTGAGFGIKGWKFDPQSITSKSWLHDYTFGQVALISATTRKRVQSLMDEVLGSDQIDVEDVKKRAKELYDRMSAERAILIARVQIDAVSSFASREAARQSGLQLKKTWVSDPEGQRHADLNGQATLFDEKYSNGLLFPGDPSGSAKDALQCRCVEVYETE